MTFPGHEQDNPQRVSAAVNTAGFVQDVVVALTRLLHDQSLTERDKAALDDCRELLRRILSTEVSLARSRDRQLAATNTVALLRKTGASGGEASAGWADAIDSLERVLAGDRAQQHLDHLRQLRETFLSLGEANLAVMTRRDPSREASDGWTTLIASSLS